MKAKTYIPAEHLTECLMAACKQYMYGSTCTELAVKRFSHYLSP